MSSRSRGRPRTISKQIAETELGRPCPHTEANGYAHGASDDYCQMCANQVSGRRSIKRCSEARVKAAIEYAHSPHNPYKVKDT